MALVRVIIMDTENVLKRISKPEDCFLIETIDANGSGSDDLNYIRIAPFSGSGVLVGRNGIQTFVSGVLSGNFITGTFYGDASQLRGIVHQINSLTGSFDFIAGPNVSIATDNTTFPTQVVVSSSITASIPSNPTVGAYQSFFGMKTRPGTSDAIPFDTTEFSTNSAMHDTTIYASGTASGSQTSTTLQDVTKTWTPNQFVGHTVTIVGGTGAGQFRTVISNTTSSLSSSAWTTTPNSSSQYQVSLSSRLVAPEDGIYEVIGHASIAFQAGILGVFFYKNGVFKSLHWTHQGQNIELNGQHTRLIPLSASDYVDMRVYNGSGSQLDLFGGIFRLTFQMTKVD